MESSLTGKEFLPANPQGKEKYVCSRCGNALFASATKFDAGCGFPSFWQHIGKNIRQNLLQTYGRERIQLVCNNCGQHLGHLFESKVTPTGARYCINHHSMLLKKQ